MQLSGSRKALAAREKGPVEEENVIEQSSQLANPEQKLIRALDLMRERRAKNRGNGMIIARGALQEAYDEDMLETHEEALLSSGMLPAISRGDKREAVAALQLAQTIAATSSANAAHVYTTLKQSLWSTAAGSTSPNAIAHSISALVMAVFALHPETHAVDCAIALCEKHASSTTTHDDSRAAAIRGAALLCSLKSQAELAAQVLPRWLPLLTASLGHPTSPGVRLAAGEFLCLLWEAAQAQAGPVTPLVHMAMSGGSEGAGGIEELSLGDAAAEGGEAGDGEEGGEPSVDGGGAVSFFDVGIEPDAAGGEEDEDDEEEGDEPAATTTTGRSRRGSKPRSGSRDSGKSTSAAAAPSVPILWDWTTGISDIISVHVGLAGGYAGSTVAATAGGIPIASAAVTRDSDRAALQTLMQAEEGGGVAPGPAALAIIIGIGAFPGSPDEDEGTSLATDTGLASRVVIGPPAALVLRVAIAGPLATEADMAAAEAATATAPASSETQATGQGAAGGKAAVSVKERRLQRAAAKEARATAPASGEAPGAAPPKLSGAAQGGIDKAGNDIPAEAAEIPTGNTGPPSITPCLALAYAPRKVIAQLRERVRAMAGETGAKHKGSGTTGQAALRAAAREIGRTILVSAAGEKPNASTLRGAAIRGTLRLTQSNPPAAPLPPSTARRGGGNPPAHPPRRGRPARLGHPHPAGGPQGRAGRRAGGARGGR